MDTTANYEVKDMKLAQAGLKNIAWAETQMGALLKIKERFAKEKGRYAKRFLRNLFYSKGYRFKI